MDDIRLASIAPYPSPEEVVQAVLMDGLEESYQGKISAPVRRQAAKITAALRRHGWRILRS